MPTITGVHHIALFTTEFDKTVAFYTKVLGLETKATFDTPDGPGVLLEISPNSYIEIFQKPAPSPAGKTIEHFCLRTDDVDAMTELVRAAGYPVTVEPKDLDLPTNIGNVHLRLSFVEGPNGESIELMSSEGI